MTERLLASDDTLAASGGALAISERTGATQAAPPPAPDPPSGPPPATLPPALTLPPPVPAQSVGVNGHAGQTSSDLQGASSSDAAALAAANTLEEHESPWRDWWHHLPSWMTSMVVHLSLVLLLALLGTVQGFRPTSESTVISTDDTGGAGGLSDDLDSLMLPAAGGLEAAPAVELPLEQLPELPDATAMANLIGPSALELPKTNDARFNAGAIGGKNESELTGKGGAGGGEGNGLMLRLNGADRAEAVRRGGGTRESEYAVELALHWLAEHQNYDGSWTFEHQTSPKCHGSCRNPGFTPGKIAATSLALLPFLGTGQTHQEGQYKKNIEQGLRFLVRSVQMQGDLGGLYEMGGQMYGHGLASIVLCEAYGMTHDQSLQVPAQSVVNFIVAAQDPHGGGWRYRPGDPGDTSVVGWQLMALKSAQMAYLRVPEMTMHKAGYFLDHVQSERGATYGYQEPSSRRPATTAIGLLCRMYLGWQHDNPGLQHGVMVLGHLGPSTDETTMRNNMYYNYYATQVMHHYGGYPWQRWNAVMRDYLIHSQAKGGHETGSWFLDGADHGAPAGGRLYCTSMAAMTLEVYYRHMPLYREQSVR